MRSREDSKALEEIVQCSFELQVTSTRAHLAFTSLRLVKFANITLERIIWKEMTSIATASHCYSHIQISVNLPKCFQENIY